jgi:hypothetical protein
MTSRSSKRAGLEGLSAFWVARRRSSLLDVEDGDADDDDVLDESVSAEIAMRRWARVGGLKEESRTKSVVVVVGVFALVDVN